MANLIPPDAKHAIIIGYWLRVITVWFVLVGCALFAVAALKTPTFVLVQSQLRTFSDQYEGARQNEETFIQVQQALNAANRLSGLLAENKEEIQLSIVINQLDTMAGDDVRISNFQLQKTEAVLNKITINGLANTRTALADFSKNVEAHPAFTEAEVPIANLAKDKDISFSIEVKPASP